LKKKGVLLEKWFTESKINLTPFARESVEFFVNNPRVRVALCTTALKEETLLKLSKNDLLRYFPVIISGSDTKRSKPWPDIYLLAVEKLKLKPEECLAFEDTEIGLRAAKSAGLNCFVIPGEFSIKQDFTKADRILKDLKEVVDLFKENSFE
jgi:HAD superfamily hydrolase (TIGR01509 family)